MLLTAADCGDESDGALLQAVQSLLSKRLEVLAQATEEVLEAVQKAGARGGALGRCPGNQQTQQDGRPHCDHLAMTDIAVR